MELGMGLFSSSNTSIFESYIDTLLLNNINYLRIDIPDYQNTSLLAQSKAAVTIAVAKGCKVIWGVSSNKGNNAAYEITAANWGTFSDAIKAAALWAQNNGVYEFQLGNEEEMHNDDTTLTDAQLIINLKTLATEVQAIFTNGNISYSCADSDLSDWITEGRGDIDIISFNVYRGGGGSFNSLWITRIAAAIAAFSAHNTYITEFSLSYTSLDDYSSDEVTQEKYIKEMIDYFETAGIQRAHFFSYIGNSFGAIKSDGVPRKLWEVLKITNDWKKRKTAGQANIRGLSHG